MSGIDDYVADGLDPYVGICSPCNLRVFRRKYRYDSNRLVSLSILYGCNYLYVAYDRDWYSASKELGKRME